MLAGADTARITAAVRGFVLPQARPALYGDGRVAARIVGSLHNQDLLDSFCDG